MISYTVFLFSAFITIQCQMYTMPYPPRPCQCGLPAIPVNPPCSNPAPIYAPYEIPATLPKMALPAVLPKMALAAAPYEILQSPPPKMAIAPYELPVPIAPPLTKMAFAAAPYELPLQIASSLPKMALASGPYELPLPIASALPKMALPAAPYELPLPVQTVIPKMAPMPPPYELALPLSLPKPACGCLETAIPRPITELPVPIGLPLNNPFLPAASPVSALAPFSPMLPPVAPCSRCQYLKKIPIPPPCI